MQTLSGRKPSQHPDELSRFIKLLRESASTSYLEIGARHGDTFYDVVMSLPAKSSALAVDLPGGAWGTYKSRAALNNAVRALRKQGYEAAAVFGDSHAPETLAAVRKWMAGAMLRKFDAVLIDGDHRYPGVLADWQAYGSLARLVALHDIAGAGQTTHTAERAPVEVPRLWAKIKATGAKHTELIAPGSRMGVGVVWPE